MKYLLLLLSIVSFNSFGQLKGFATYTKVDNSNEIPYYQGGYVKKDKEYWYQNDRSECGVNAVMQELNRLLEVNEIEFDSYDPEDSEFPAGMTNFTVDQVMFSEEVTLFWVKDGWRIIFFYGEFGTTIMVHEYDQ